MDFIFRSCLRDCKVASLRQLFLMAWNSLYLPGAGCSGFKGKHPLLLSKRAGTSIHKMTLRFGHFGNVVSSPLG